MNVFCVNSLSNWSQNLTSSYVSVPITDKVERNNDIPSANALRMLASPYKTPGLEPDGYKSFFYQKWHLDLLNF